MVIRLMLNLIELVEGRIGGLPSPVSDVIDALAVGEPIELGALTRITDPAAVEQADIRGLIALDQVGDRVEARLAHPLYGRGPTKSGCRQQVTTAAWSGRRRTCRVG